ncbi:vomeronasal type-1 receptor 1-like [Trichosurus vulpecula]|uniref:vomeronasal type-1 receptor 1-like n=1 Tax=Trichosurus vulpecula TaxID=9337 RepID=UPI00186B487D|nr:vomeronasal type-1 receptor 1-like [Trichosurus vulpecula]
MISYKDVLGIIYLIQFMSGILGNSLLFCFYSINFKSEHNKRSVDPFLIHLAFVNTMMLLFRGVPKIIEIWGWENFLDDIGCKLITYLQRMSRGLSLCSISLLSVFQVITISPNSPLWALLKARSHKCIIPCCLFCWVVNLLMDIFVPLYVTSPSNSTNKGRKNLGYCLIDMHAMSPLKVHIWKSLYDSLLVGIMTCSSVYMVVFLYRHRQQVVYIHSTNLSSRVTPEIRATKAILLLVTTFACFNIISGPFILYVENSNGTISWADHITAFLSMSFQSISPFVMITSDTQIHKSCSIL